MFWERCIIFREGQAPHPDCRKSLFLKSTSDLLSLSPCPLSPGKGVNTGTGVPATRLGATPKARMLWLLAKSFARCKTSRASNAKRPFLIMIEVFRQSAGGASPSPTNMSHYIIHFSFNGDTQTVTLKSTIKTDILFPTFFIFPIDKTYKFSV